MKSTIWNFGVIIGTTILLLICGGVIIYIDPLFHFHKPIQGLNYPLINQLYQNDGITRQFDYDAIITGSSMTENFMTSQFDTLWNADSIKVPYSGSALKETGDLINKALNRNTNVKYVLRCIDYTRLLSDKDEIRSDVVYPTYLFNDEILDDINYILNKDVLCAYCSRVYDYTKEGKEQTSFDEYCNWNKDYTFGKDAVLATYERGERATEDIDFTDDDARMVRENIQQNVTFIANQHPKVTFYIFFSPYSISYWDQLEWGRGIDAHLSAEQIAIEEMLQCPNIKLYSFCNNFDLTCDLNNYKDAGHYGEWVNREILDWIYCDEYRLTEDNYMAYLHEIKDFYESYDYSSLRE